VSDGPSGHRLEAAVRGPRAAGFGALLLTLLAGKLCWLLLRGVSYEMDTATYLLFAVPYHHPPGYSQLLAVLLQLYPDVHLVAGTQALLFGLGGALFVARFAGGARRRAWAALLLAVDPATSFLCANLMSDALFLALLLPWLCLVASALRAPLTGRRTWVLLGTLGALSAALYATRLAAVILPLFFLIATYLSSFSFRRTALHGLLVLAAFNVSILPVKLLYWQRYGTFTVAAFTGSNLWNNAAVLYPDSSLRRRPETDFERFLATRGVEEFTTLNSLWSNHIHTPNSAYDTYLREHAMDFRQLRHFNAELARTAGRLIRENPLGYLTRFVLPNLAKPFVLDDEIAPSPEVETLVERTFGYHQPRIVLYRAWAWWIYAGLLLGASAALLAGASRRTLEAHLLVGFCWYYVLVLPWLSAISTRYLLPLTPVILVAGVILARSATRTSSSSAG